MKQELESLEFKTSKYNICLFMYKTKKIILLLYIDNCLFFCENNKKLINIINEIQNLFNLTEQNIDQDIFMYLGIELIFDRTKIIIKQKGLIKKLFETIK